MSKRNNEEHRIQCAIVKWARDMSRTHPELGLLYAIPNGGNRDAVTGAIMKREGVLAGIPDLCLPVQTIFSGAIYLEVKTPRGRVSNAQESIHRNLRKQGNEVFVVRSAQDGIELIRNYLGLDK